MSTILELLLLLNAMVSDDFPYLRLMELELPM